MSTNLGPQISIGRDRAVAMPDNWWHGRSNAEVAIIQMSVEELMMPFADFHHCLENALCRPVFTHELVTNYDTILSDLLKIRPTSAEEIQRLINELPH